MEFLGMLRVSSFVWVAFRSHLTECRLDLGIGRITVHSANKFVERRQAEQDLDKGPLAGLPGGAHRQGHDEQIYDL